MTAVLDRRLIMVGGKGGVGRSTVAAAIGAACARRGRRTLLFQAGAEDRFGAFFDAPPVGTELTRLSENLYAVNTNPAAALEEYGLMILRFRRIYRLVFENRVTKYFLRGIPGLDDYAILGKAWFHTKPKTASHLRFDTVVIDLPASGHSLSMLKIPWVITETVPEGPLTRDAHTIKSLLTDHKRAALVLTTLAEEMPANEAAELSSTLRNELGIDTAHLIVNQVFPDRFAAGSPSRAIVERLAGDPSPPSELGPALEHARLAMSRRELNDRYLAQLDDSVPGPRTVLPMLFCDSIGGQEVQLLSQLLERDLG